MEPEISTRVLRNLIEKLGAKFPDATRGYSMAIFVCLNDAFSEIFDREGSPVECQSLQEKDKKRRKMKDKKT